MGSVQDMRVSCRRCGKLFVPMRPGQVYCGQKSPLGICGAAIQEPVEHDPDEAFKKNQLAAVFQQNAIAVPEYKGKQKRCVGCFKFFFTEKVTQVYCNNICRGATIAQALKSETEKRKAAQEKAQIVEAPVVKAPVVEVPVVIVPKKTFVCTKCGETYSAEKAGDKLCSEDCRQAVYHSKVRFSYCDFCEKIFSYLSSGGKPRYFCSKGCRQNYNEVLQEMKRDREMIQTACLTCGTLIEHYANVVRRHCSDKCRKEYKRDITCKHCGVVFKSSSSPVYCSPECKATALIQREAEALEKPSRVVPLKAKACYTNFNELCFVYEEEFVHWFESNYSVFGFESVLYMDRFFPDCLATTYGGEIIRVELEHHASNFALHGHPSYGCDLIVSFLKTRNQKRVAGVPVLAVFDVWGEWESRQLTEYFQEMVTRNSIQLLSLIADNGERSSASGYRMAP
jgi:hypothetical protein